MKRSNGAGSISKLSGNRRKPWRVRKTIGWIDGKQMYKIVGYFKTKKEALQALALDDVMPVSDHANLTLKQLFEEWKNTRAYTDLSKQTQDNYNAAFKYMSEYHTTKFNNLRLAHFQSMIDGAAALGRSKSTMEKIKALSGILTKYYEGKETIRLPKSDKRTIPTFTETEIQTLFNNDSVPLVDTILIMIYTGMRITELLTLTKFNVDINNMVVIGGIKTEAGTDRVIPIHPKIQKYIKARYDSADNYIIEENGKKYSADHYRNLYYQTLDNLNIRRLTPHKARHTFFTMLTDNCQDRKGIALVGGHTDPNFTDKTYVQPDLDRLRRVIETLP